MELSLMAKDWGIRPSELIGISEEIPALDFDRACSIRLRLYEAKEKRNDARRMALAIMSANAGQLPEFDEDKDEYMESLPEAW